MDRLRASGGRGCVVLGEPRFYRRFGFRSGAGLIYPGAPPGYFQSMAVLGEHLRGVVVYHSAFAQA